MRSPASKNIWRTPRRNRPRSRLRHRPRRKNPPRHVVKTVVPSRSGPVRDLDQKKPTRREQESSEPKKETAKKKPSVNIKMAAMPVVEQPAASASKPTEKVQKPDIALPQDAIRKAKAGAAPLQQFTQSKAKPKKKRERERGRRWARCHSGTGRTRTNAFVQKEGPPRPETARRSQFGDGLNPPTTTNQSAATAATGRPPRHASRRPPSRSVHQYGRAAKGKSRIGTPLHRPQLFGGRWCWRGANHSHPDGDGCRRDH